MPNLLSLFIARLKLPWLFLLSAVLLVVNLIVPDPVPLLDEVLLALITAVLGSLRKPKKTLPPAEGD